MNAIDTNLSNHHSLFNSPWNIFIESTEKAAIASYSFVGSGKRVEADQAAVHAMRQHLNTADFTTRVAIGEGERDKAPMLFINEVLGKKIAFMNNAPHTDKHTTPQSWSSLQTQHNIQKNMQFQQQNDPQTAITQIQTSYDWDIAVDPLEGTNLCALNRPGAMSVMLASKSGRILNCPDVYMQKIALGPDILASDETLDIDIAPQDLVALIASRKNKTPTICVLNRERHHNIINSLQSANAKVHLIDDGDISASIMTCMNDKIDAYIGIGGAPEGVIAAGALQGLGGRMFGRLHCTEDDLHGYNLNKEKQYTEKELVTGDLLFAASGVTTGDMVKGITPTADGFAVESLIIHISRGCSNVMRMSRVIR